MYKRILVPTDGSRLSNAAMKSAATLAKKLGASITSVYVIPPYMPPPDPELVAFYAAFSQKEYERAMHKSADHALAKAKALAAAAKVKAEGVAVTGASPWKSIIATAKAKKSDLIVMASHGRRGIEALIMGSETQKVLTHSRIPVLVCR